MAKSSGGFALRTRRKHVLESGMISDSRRGSIFPELLQKRGALAGTLSLLESRVNLPLGR